MAAMTSRLDDVHLEDSICVSFKDVKKQGNLRYCMLSTLTAIMVEILHALHNLWATLYPFALLWWNAMLYATCSKYYSWNRSRLRLQIARQSFYGDIMLESCSSSEAASGVKREKSLFSPHETGSTTDASHAENREMSVFSLYHEGTCAEAVYVKKNDVGSTSPEQRILHCWHHVSVDSFPHRSGFCMLDRCGDVTAACLGESGPHHLNQFEEIVSRETTSLASKAQAIAASSLTSKLSSLCFLEGRQPQPSGLLKGCHWAACSFLSPHQVRPLAMLDVHHCPQIPLEYSCLQVNLHRSNMLNHRKGNMLNLQVPVLIDHVSINWLMLRDWLQTLNRGCVPAVNFGKKYQDLAWNFTKFLTPQTRNDNYAILQFILSTSVSFNNVNTIYPYGAIEIVKLRIGEHRSSWGLSGFKMKSNIVYVDNEDSGSASSEDIGSVSCTSTMSDDGCNDMYCTGAESTLDKDDDFEDSGVIYGKQCYGDDGYCCYYRGYEDIGIASVEDAKDIHGSFVHPVMYKGDGFYDGSDHCDVGYDGPHCVTDVDGTPGMDYDVAGRHDNNFGDNVEDIGAVCGDFHFVCEDGVYENPLDTRQIHVATPNTWWDEGAVLVDKQESEEDSIEQEWQVVQV